VEAGDVHALENNSLACYRAAGGSPAVRLGVGTAAISPDGKWVLLASNHVSPKLPLQLEPIGPGNAKDLSTPGLIAFDHYAWSDDGRQVVYGGQTDQNQWNVCRPAVEGGAPVLVKTAARDAYPYKSSRDVGDRHTHQTSLGT